MNAATSTDAGRGGRIGSLIVFLVVPQLVGILGALGTGTGMTPWYAELNKPSFQPPSWVFGPVWTLLYLSMGYAAWRVYQHWPRDAARRTALTWFGAQLVLNAAWSPIFFGAHAITLALGVIVLLWIAVLGTILTFRKVDALASYLLWPYLAWVSFATVLNAAIVHLN